MGLLNTNLFFFLLKKIYFRAKYEVTLRPKLEIEIVEVEGQEQLKCHDQQVGDSDWRRISILEKPGRRKRTITPLVFPG